MFCGPGIKCSFHFEVSLQILGSNLDVFFLRGGQEFCRLVDIACKGPLTRKGMGNPIEVDKIIVLVYYW